MYTNIHVCPSQLANRRTRSPSLDETLEPNTMATAPEGGHKVSTGTLAREREKFFDLLRTKYPEHDKGIEEFLSVRDKTSEKVSYTEIHTCTCTYIHKYDIYICSEPH